MALVDFRVDGEQELREGLRQAARLLSAKGRRRLLEGFGDILERGIGEAFESERAPQNVAPVGRAASAAGRGWDKLAALTLLNRRKAGGGAKILQDTGTGRHVSRNVTSNHVEVGTPLQYMLYQHGGTNPYTIVPRNAKFLRFMGPGGPIFTKRVDHPGLPPRPFIGYGPREVKSMLRWVSAQLRRAMG